MEKKIEKNIEEKQPEAEKSKGREILEMVIYLVCVAIVCLLIVKFVAYRCVVSGPSMQHTFENNDNLIAERVSYYFRKPERFEVIIFTLKEEYMNQVEEEHYLIKRVIGLPGETVSIKDGKVHINGEVLEEDVYAQSGYTSAMQPVTLGENEYFVLGDNRDNSKDSRYFGPVKMADINGRAWVRIWPFSRMGAIRK